MKKYYFILSMLFVAKIFAQQIVDAGDDVYICPDQTAATLHAKVLSADILTGRYKVEYTPFEWDIDMLGAKNILNTNGWPLREDDTYSDVIDLPFPISFFGKTYDKLIVNPDGNVVFDISLAGQGQHSTMLPTQLIPDATILPFHSEADYGTILFPYHDLDVVSPAQGKKLQYKVEGTAPNRRFIIMLFNIPMYVCDNFLVNQMLIFNEADNSIEVHVKTKPVCSLWNRGLAVLGIQNEELSPDTCGNYPGDATSPSLPNRNTGVWTVEETNPEAYKFVPDANVIYTWTDEDGNVVGSSKNPDIDVHPTKDTEYTLEVSYEDCHGNTYKEYDTVTVHVLPEQELELKEQEILCEGGEQTLNGKLTNESDFNTVSYTWTDPNGNIISHDAVLEVDSAGVYTLTVETENTCSKTYPIKVRIYEGCKIPEGISPNGDGLNDAFVLDYYAGEVGIETFQVFDRKGVLVYEKHDYVKEFVGKDNNGNELPSATYYYVFQLKNGEKHTGWFQLIR